MFNIFKVLVIAAAMSFIISIYASKLEEPTSIILTKCNTKIENQFASELKFLKDQKTE